MKKCDVIEDLFYDFYFHDVRKEKSIEAIELDTQAVYLIRNLQHCERYQTTTDFANAELSDYFKNLVVKDFGLAEDQLIMEKRILHIPYHWYASLSRLEIISEAIDAKTCIEILGISIEEIYRITCIIILRTIMFATLESKNSELPKQYREKIYHDTNPSVWFTADELITLDPQISKDSFDIYVSQFAQNINGISEQDDSVYYLYYDNGRIAIIFIDDFANYIFCVVENIIIQALKTFGEPIISKYKDKRGKALEQYVYNLMHGIYPSTFLNMNYVDEDKAKRELDVVLIAARLILNIECKSSRFNLYECNSDAETYAKINGAFGDALKSINAFHATAATRPLIELYKRRTGEKVSLDVSSQAIVSVQVTLYPIDLVGTYLHLFNQSQIGKFKVYPINIGLPDFFAIAFLASLNAKPIEEYFIKRFETINCSHELQLDVDELDALGLLTDESNEWYKKLIDANENKAKMIISVSNSAYRKEINELLTDYGLKMVCSEYVDTSVHDAIQYILGG